MSGIQVWKEIKQFGYNLQNETNLVYQDRSPSSQTWSHFFLEIWGSPLKCMGNFPNWKRIQFQKCRHSIHLWVEVDDSMSGNRWWIPVPEPTAPCPSPFTMRGKTLASERHGLQSQPCHFQLCSLNKLWSLITVFLLTSLARQENERNVRVAVKLLHIVWARRPWGVFLLSPHISIFMPPKLCMVCSFCLDYLSSFFCLEKSPWSSIAHLRSHLFKEACWVLPGTCSHRNPSFSFHAQEPLVPTWSREWFREACMHQDQRVSLFPLRHVAWCDRAFACCSDWREMLPGAGNQDFRSPCTTNRGWVPTVGRPFGRCKDESVQDSAPKESIA